MVFKTDMIKSWIGGTSSSVNSEIITPFRDASTIIGIYNNHVKAGTLTQENWSEILKLCDDSLASYLTRIKGLEASTVAYNVALQGNIKGFKKIRIVMQQYNALETPEKQQEFASAVALTNSKFGNYLSNLKGSNATLIGYGFSLVTATAKTIALNVATMALNTALSMGVSIIVSSLIGAFMSWVNSSKKITEEAEKARNKVKSINDDLKSHTETIENSKQRYAELAQSVENLGRVNQNRGILSTDDYDEFLDLSNQLAGIFPQLTKGYDENGNAILNLSGDVDTIVSSLDDLLKKEQEVANHQIAEQFPKVYKGYIQDLEQSKKDIKTAKKDFDYVNKMYQELQNGELVRAFDRDGNNKELNKNIDVYTDELKKLGVKYTTEAIRKKDPSGTTSQIGTKVIVTSDINNAFAAKLDSVRQNYQYAKQELEDEKESINSYLTSWLSDEPTYKKINNSDLQSAIQSMILNFDFLSLPEDIQSDPEAVTDYLRKNILYAINDIQNDPEISKAFTEVFTNQDLTPSEKSEYLNKIKDYFDDAKGKNNAVSVALKPEIKDAKDLENSYDQAIERFSNHATEKQSKAMAEAQQNLEDEYQKISDWGLDDYADQIKNGTLPSQFGNVDMDNRQIIDWNIDNIERWKDALSDIKYYDEDGNFVESYYDQLEESAKNGESCIDTVFGDLMDKIEGYGDITALSFSHVVNNDDGTFEFLGQKTAEEYLYGILDMAKKDGDMSIDHILELDKKGFKNAEVYDAQGKVIGETYIHGIISGFNENAEDISELTHFAGKYGAVQIAKDEIAELEKQFGKDGSQTIKDFFDTEGINTQEEIDEFNSLTSEITDATKAIAKWNESKNASPSNSLQKFLDIFNSAEFNESKQKLLDLAASGELTSDTISSTEDYKKLIDETGMSAGEVVRQIEKLVTATKKLNSTSTGLSGINEIYKQVTDKDKGFADIDKIEGLDDKFKQLDYYKEFSRIVGDGKHTVEEQKQAINKLVSEYLEYTDALDNVNEKDKELYVNQLENMGISNARSLVSKQLALNYVNETKALKGLTEANKAEYIAKLKAQNISDDIAEALVNQKINDDALENSTKRMHSSTHTAEEYAKAHNNLKDLLDEETHTTLVDFEKMTTKDQLSLLDEAEASGICRNAVLDLQIAQIKFNNTKITVDDKLKSLSDLAKSYGITNSRAEALIKAQEQINGMNAGGVQVMYTAEQIEEIANQTYDEIKASIDAKFDGIVNGSSILNSDGGADYTGDKDDTDKNSSKSNSKQAYDWIEVKLKKIAEATEKLGEAFEKTFTISSTNSKFTEYLNQISEEISANYTAISAYQSKLNSIGLSSDWVQKIQNGEYSIDEIQDNDDLKEKISDYQTYWDKLKSCYDTIDDLEEKRLTAENNYAQKIIEYYDKEIEKTEKLISRREKLASIKESWGSSASSRDLKYQLNMTAQQIGQTQHETDGLTRLQQTVSYGTDAWDTYQDKIVSNNESVVELTSSYADLAEQLTNLPIDKAEKAIDKLNKKLDLITGRYDVSDSFKVLNKLLNKQTANSKKQLNAYTKAYKSTSSNLQTAWNNVQIAANSPANRGKKFGEELSTAGLQVNSVAYRAVIQYNTALSKNKDALYNVQKAQLEYTKTVRENTKAQYDNIKSYYAATLSYKESGTNNAQTKVDYKSDADYTLTQDDYKRVLSSKKNELGVSVAERKQYKLKRLEKQYKNGEISREDYLSQLEYINTLDSNIIKLRSDIVSTAQEMANLASTNADKKIEKLDNKDEVYDLKSSNAIGHSNKNSFVTKEMANINKRQQIYASAYKENAKNLKSYSRRISSTKATKDNKNILEKVKSYVKGGKKIPVSLMDKVFALGDRTLYANCETYNQFLESTKTSKEVYDKYKEQAKQDKAEKANQKLENIQNYYSNKQSVYSQRQQQLNNRMDIITAKGYNVSSKFYDSLIAEESKNNKSLKEERDKLTSSLANSLRNGSIKKYSDEWYEATQKIDDTTNAIDESTKSLIEFENAQRQLKWDNNDFLQERFSNLTSEIDFAIKELGREDLSDDDIGGLTDRGRASASLNLANYLIAQRQAVEYEKEIKELQKDLEKDPYNKNTIERLDEVRKSYEDITSAMQDNKYAIIDLYSQGYDALLNKIKDLISKFTDMLDTEKDAFDYQNNISDKVKEISDLRKQISIYNNVATTEENRANIQKLNKSLADAEKDLQQTQYDKYISDTKDMLSDLEDNMSDSIQDIIKWLSSDEGFKGLIEEIKNNSDVNEYIKSFLEGISYNPSGELQEALNGSDISVSTKESIKDIKNWMSQMLEYTEKIADTDTKTAADLVKEKTIKDGKNTLNNDVRDMSDQYNAKKAEKDNASSELSKSRITYEAAKKLFGKDSDVTKLAKKQYSDSKVKYGVLNQETNELKKKFKAMEYLSKNLDVTEESRSKLNDVNKKFYDAYGQRVLDDKELKELAKILGVKSDDGKSSGNLYKALKDMGINGFAVGSKHMPYDQLALLGEEGAELHFDKSNGILRQVGQGDMIFTSEMAKNLWEMAQTSPIKFNEISLPNLQRPNMSTNTIVEVGDIVLNGVNDTETLGRQIREEICKNGKTTTCVAEAVSARQLGKGIGKAKLYR